MSEKFLEAMEHFKRGFNALPKGMEPVPGEWYELRMFIKVPKEPDTLIFSSPSLHWHHVFPQGALPEYSIGPRE